MRNERPVMVDPRQPRVGQAITGLVLGIGFVLGRPEVLPAVAVVLAVRALEPGGRSLELALGELAVYLGVTAAATWYLEAALLREAAGYVFGRGTAKVAV